MVVSVQRKDGSLSSSPSLLILLCSTDRNYIGTLAAGVPKFSVPKVRLSRPDLLPSCETGNEEIYV